jgi:hypothetical protein
VLSSGDGNCNSFPRPSHKPNHGHNHFLRHARSFGARAGPSESAYQGCLAHDLKKRALAVASQVGLLVVFDGEKIELGYRIDLVVENLVIVEVKSVEAIHPVTKRSSCPTSA